MSIHEVALQCHEIANDHGFWDGVELSDAVVSEKLMLMVDEISEAHEELRTHGFASDDRFVYFKGEKPEGLAIELADAVIRIFDLAVKMGFNIEEAILLKMKYNKTRPYKHGRRF